MELSAGAKRHAAGTWEPHSFIGKSVGCALNSEELPPPSKRLRYKISHQRVCFVSITPSLAVEHKQRNGMDRHPPLSVRVCAIVDYQAPIVSFVVKAQAIASILFFTMQNQNSRPKSSSVTQVASKFWRRQSKERIRSTVSLQSSTKQAQLCTL